MRGCQNLGKPCRQGGGTRGREIPKGSRHVLSSTAMCEGHNAWLLGFWKDTETWKQTTNWKTKRKESVMTKEEKEKKAEEKARRKAELAARRAQRRVQLAALKNYWVLLRYDINGRACPQDFFLFWVRQLLIASQKILIFIFSYLSLRKRF